MKLDVTNMSSESGTHQEKLAILTRKSRLKRGQVDWVVLKAGLVCLLLHVVFYAVWQFYPPMHDLVDQYRFLVVSPLFVLVLFFLGRAFLLLYREFRK